MHMNVDLISCDTAGLSKTCFFSHIHFGPSLELSEEPQFPYLKTSYRRFPALCCHALSPALKTDGTAIETGESSAIAPTKTSSKLISTFLAAAHGMQARYTNPGNENNLKDDQNISRNSNRRSPKRLKSSLGGRFPCGKGPWGNIRGGQ